MSLYVRVYNSFYTHRKTMRLKAVIGESALWVPPRLWAYAAEHQPDGCFKDFSAEEIAMLIGYSGDAKSMLQALLRAGFLNADMTIHDWGEHNGYHATYIDRAKKAANSRWKKERTKEKGTGEESTRKERKGDKHCLEHACSIPVGFVGATEPSEFEKLRSEMNVFWQRDDQFKWGYVEEHAAVEVSRRKDWRKEWEEIQSYLAKIKPEDKRYEPATKSLEKLLNGWNSALDAARNAITNAKPKPPIRNAI